MKKFSAFFEQFTSLIRIRDIFYIITLIMAYELILAEISTIFTDPLYSLCAFLCGALLLAILVLIYVARWYKSETGSSLYCALLSPDREGSVFQLLSRARKAYADRDRNKSNGWNTQSEGDGVLLGYIGRNPIVSPTDAEEHILCIGGSGSGKTRNILIPTTKRWHGGLFAIDISGDIYRAIQSERDICHINTDGKSTHSFNVFAQIDNEPNPSKKIILLKRLANLIIPETDKSRSGSSIYFYQGSHLLFYAALIYYYFKGMDFCELCYEIQCISANTLISKIKKDGNANAKLLINEFSGLRSENLASMKQTLDAHINIFSTSRIVKGLINRGSTEKPSISADELENKAVILSVPQNDVEVFSPVLRLLSGLVLDYCATRKLYPEKRILICLDEFSSLGFLDIIRPLATLRKYGTRIMIFTQSLSDIEDIYGIEKRKIICDNCRIKVVLSATDSDTQEYLSKLVGTREAVSRTHTYTNGESRHSYTTVEAPIIRPEEFGYLQAESVVLLPDGYMRLSKLPVFENKHNFFERF